MVPPIHSGETISIFLSIYEIAGLSLTPNGWCLPVQMNQCVQIRSVAVKGVHPDGQNSDLVCHLSSDHLSYHLVLSSALQKLKRGAVL